MKSGVYDVYNRSAWIRRAMLDSARMAATKAAFDTEAEAKKEITLQVYTGAPRDPLNPPTGAARASIYANVPGKSGYKAAASEAKGRNPKAVLFDEVPISKLPSSPEAVVAVGVEYGANIEFGSTSRNMPARPYMEPAVNKVMPQFERFCLQNLKAVLR